MSAAAIIVYAGIVGNNSATLDTQVATFLRKEAHASSVAVSSEGRKILARHLPGTEALVRRYHANGLVVGELVRSDHGAIARLVVYDGDGHRKDLVEIPLDGNSFDESGLDALRSNLLPDVLALEGQGEPGGAAASGGGGGAGDEIPPTGDGEAPLAEGSAPAGDTPAEAAAPDTPPAGDSTVAAEAPPPHKLHLRVAAGLGVTTRSFSVDNVALRGYSSNAVTNLGFAAEVDPLSSLTLRAEYQITLGMITALPEGNASTTSERWQLSGIYGFNVGKSIALQPLVGLGQRTFLVDSSDSDRSPNAGYTYLALGAGAQYHATALTLGAWFSVEPSIGGNQPSAAETGSASRLGLEGRITADVPVSSWFFVRGEAYLQHFSWSFPAANGGGSASDSYLAATLMVGFKY